MYYLVVCSYNNVDDGYGWSFPGVYRPNEDSNRSSLWKEIAVLCSCWDGLGCIGGILISLSFCVRGQGILVLVKPWQNFLILFFYLDLV